MDGHVARRGGGGQVGEKGSGMDAKRRIRKVGRPKTRCEGEIIQVGGVAWKRNAAYRSQWKQVGEAYAQGREH